MSQLRKIVIVLLVASSPFSLTIFGDFVFDDSEAILNNADVVSNDTITIFYNDFWGNNIKSNSSHKSYRPLTILTFRMNYYLAGYKLIPAQFRITNLLIHCACCIVALFTYQALYKGSRKQMDVPLFSTILFGVHPVHVEAVCGIVGRADMLAAITFLAALLFYIKSVHGSGFHSYLHLSCAIGLAATSMLCKENGITVLGVCCIYELLYNNQPTTQDATNQRNSTKSQNKLSAIISPIIIKVSFIRFFILMLSLIILLLARWMIMGGTRPKFQEIDNPAAFAQDFLTRVASYNYIYFINLLILIWPQWLCFDWSMGCVPLLKNLTDIRLIFVLLMYGFGIATLKFLLNDKKKGRRTVVLGLALMIVPFIPASNLLFPVGFVVAERVLYIPSIGFCLLVALGMKKLMYLDKNKLYKPLTAILWFLLLFFNLRCCNRTIDWIDEYRLFTSALRVCPRNAKVHYNIAKAADERNLTAFAVYEYDEAIKLYPEYYQAMNNLANLLKTQKRYMEALDLLKTAIYHKTDFPPAWMNLGIVLAQLGSHEQALSAYTTALKYRRRYPDCYYNMGNLYLEMQLPDKAGEAWLEAIKLNPKHQTAWTNLLALLDNTGQSEKALMLIPKALEELPDSPSIIFILANIYGKMNNFVSSEKYFVKAIRLFGKRVQAIHYANLGVLYHRWKKFKLAEEKYKQALALDPGFESAKKNLISLQSIM